MILTTYLLAAICSVLPPANSPVTNGYTAPLLNEYHTSASARKDGVPYTFHEVFMLWSCHLNRSKPVFDAVHLEFYAQHTVDLAFNGEGTRIVIIRFKEDNQPVYAEYRVAAREWPKGVNDLERNQAKDKAFDGLRDFLNNHLVHPPSPAHPLKLNAALELGANQSYNATEKYRSLVLCLEPGGYINPDPTTINPEPIYQESGPLREFYIGLYVLGSIAYDEHSYLYKVQKFHLASAAHLFTDKRKAIR